MDFDILFPDERERGETPIRQSQMVMLRMLKVLDYLCNKHGIQYFLVGGTLLGAVRHQGFIPWDDDLDTGMTRENYEKFVKLAVPELPDDIFFQVPETDPYYSSCAPSEARLRDKYSSYKLTGKKLQAKYHKGLMLDILVYDRSFLPHKFFVYALNRCMMALYWGVGENNKGNQKRTKTLRIISKLSPFPLVYASGFTRRRFMLKLGANYVRPKEIAKLVRTKFEDMEAYIPQGWDACLKRQYGNYMKLPPVEQQTGHHGADLPDPFTPCDHAETLMWKNRKVGNMSS